MKITKKS